MRNFRLIFNFSIDIIYIIFSSAWDWMMLLGIIPFVYSITFILS